MFSSVVVGVKELEAGRDALRLARALTSARGNLTLVHVQVAAPKPAPDSGAAGAAAMRRNELQRLAALRDESQLDAELACAEARSVRQRLHDVARARNADLLVVGASRNDLIYRDLVGPDTRVLLEDTPCTVAVAPVGYVDRRAPMRRIGIAYGRSPESDCALAVARTLAAERHVRLSAFQAVSGPGHVEDAIDDRRSVDLLVLGSPAHGRIGRLPREGTAQRLADEPPCPLLAVADDGAIVPSPIDEFVITLRLGAIAQSRKVRDDGSPTRLGDSGAN